MADRGEWGNRGPRRPPTRGRGARPPGPQGRRGPAGQAQAAPRPRAGGIQIRTLEPGVFELVHPRCVEELRPDFEEGLALLEAGEPEDARDALRFALQGCGDNLWVHVALGRIALEHAKDPRLARGHFGYAVELARQSIPRGFPGKLPPQRPANRPFFEAMAGLVACCEALGLASDAEEIRSESRRLGGGG